jgi:hypothetical protein
VNAARKPGGAPLASFVLRVERRGGSLAFLVQDLRNGRQYDFRRVHCLRRWLAAAMRNGLK